MLNHIWLALILLGSLLAIGKDAVDLAVNRFRNGQELAVSLEFYSAFSGDLSLTAPLPCSLLIDPQVFQRFYDAAPAGRTALAATGRTHAPPSRPGKAPGHPRCSDPGDLERNPKGPKRLGGAYGPGPLGTVPRTAGNSLDVL